MNTICNASTHPRVGGGAEGGGGMERGGGGGGRGPILAPNITIFQAFAKSNLTISLGTDLPAG